MSSGFKTLHKSSRSRKGKHKEDNTSHDSAPKAGPSTVVTAGRKDLPGPGIFQTRPSRPLHTSPSFERGRHSTRHGDLALDSTSAEVTGAGGRGEASYSRAGSPSSAPPRQSSSSNSTEPGPSRRRRQPHPADTRQSEAWRAMGDNYTHANDPGFWQERRLSEAAMRRAQKSQRREPDSCCALL